MQEAALYTIRAGQNGVNDLQWWPGSSSMFGVATQGGTTEASPCIHSGCAIPILNLAGCLHLCCRNAHSPKSPPACLPCSTEDSHLVSISLSLTLQSTVQVWDVSESVDSPQTVYDNPAPHPFTSISVCPAFPVIAAGDSSGTVALLRSRKPKESRDA